MMSDYYKKEDLITLFKQHILPIHREKVNYDKVISEGEIYPKMINGVTGTYIYEVDCIEGNITVFVHPTICVEIFYDPFQSKEMYMTGNLII